MPCGSTVTMATYLYAWAIVTNQLCTGAVQTEVKAVESHTAGSAHRYNSTGRHSKGVIWPPGTSTVATRNTLCAIYIIFLALTVTLQYQQCNKMYAYMHLLSGLYLATR